MPDQTDRFRVSVIIPTYNRASLLRESLKSLINQSIPASMYEIIVIDDGSTDSTRSVVEDLNHRSRYAMNIKKMQV